jgi:hypothetical protein
MSGDKTESLFITEVVEDKSGGWRVHIEQSNGGEWTPAVRFFANWEPMFPRPMIAVFMIIRFLVYGSLKSARVAAWGCHPMFRRPKCLADLAAARGSCGDAIDAAGVDDNRVHRLGCSHFGWVYSSTWLLFCDFGNPLLDVLSERRRGVEWNHTLARRDKH